MKKFSKIPEIEHSEFESNLHKRHRSSNFWLIVFRISTVVGVIALLTLLLNVSNSTMGYAAIHY